MWQEGTVKESVFCCYLHNLESTVFSLQFDLFWLLCMKWLYKLLAQNLRPNLFVVLVKFPNHCFSDISTSLC